MSAQELITEHLDLWTGAVTKKSSSGRGSNGKVELTGIKKLRELILELAVRGLLTDQLSTDKSANKLLEKIIPEVKKLIKDGRFKVPKETKSKSAEEAPFKIPQTWAWCSLDQIAVIARGGSPRPIKAYITTAPDGLNWIKIGDAKKGSRLITKVAEKIIPEGLQKTRKVYPGDLILSNSMSFGQPYILDIEGCIHDGWLLLRTPESLVDKVFLYYLLLSPYAMNAFTDSAAGAVVQNLNADKVRLLQVPLPPLEEQHRIVQKVDELMALCDRLEQQTSDQLEAHENLVDTLLVTLTQSENATELADNWARLAAHFDTLFTTEQSIDKLKKAILQLAVMGRLVEQDPNDEPASMLLKRIAEEKARLVKEGKIKKPKKLPEIAEEEKPFELPEGWLWARMEAISEYIQRGKGPKYADSGKVRVVSQKCIQWSGFDLNASRFIDDSSLSGYQDERYIRNNDILWNSTGTGTVGRAIVAKNQQHPIVADSHVTIIRPQATNPSHILNYISSPSVQQRIEPDHENSLVSGTTKQVELNSGSVKLLAVPFPPLEEQHRIVEKVDELMALCDQLKNRLAEAGATRTHLAEAVVEQAVQ